MCDTVGDAAEEDTAATLLYQSVPKSHIVMAYSPSAASRPLTTTSSIKLLDPLASLALTVFRLSVPGESERRFFSCEMKGRRHELHIRSRIQSEVFRKQMGHF